MRLALALALVAGCVSPLYTRAGERLGVHGKHLHLDGEERIGDRDVYVFCRREHKTPLGAARSYDGACVTFVCPAGSDRNCDE
jgi:hypothetical protein